MEKGLLHQVVKIRGLHRGGGRYGGLTASWISKIYGFLAGVFRPRLPVSKRSIEKFLFTPLAKI